MKTLDVTHDLPIPAEAAWTVLADFGGFLKWAGGGQGSLEAEGDGIGMIRHMQIPGVGKMAERLDRLEPDSATLGYTLVYGNPIGMAEYRAVVKLEPMDQAHCRIHWHGEFHPVEGEDARTVAENLENSYRGMSDALVAFAQGA